MSNRKKGSWGHVETGAKMPRPPKTEVTDAGCLIIFLLSLAALAAKCILI